MPQKRKRKETKAEIHESIGELLHSAKVRCELLSETGSKAQKKQAEKAASEIRRAHSKFKSTYRR